MKVKLFSKLGEMKLSLTLKFISILLLPGVSNAFAAGNIPDGQEQFAAQQQNLQVSGTVTDSFGEPVIGATVVVVGNPSHGTVTNVDGYYTLSNVPSNANLVFSYVGMDPETVAVNGRTTINVVLLEGSETLEEVVITALGRKADPRALGYAISTVRGDDMIKAGVTSNALQTLYGKAAGVGIQSTAAGPMGGVKIQVRGAQGLESSSNTRPLFVVDGVPLYDTESSMTSRDYNPLNSFDYGSAVNDLNVEDIESMEILKGAQAAVLYGSYGANGVVLITTKSGAGTRGLGVQVSYGQETFVPTSYIDFQNEFGSGQNEYSLREIVDPATGKTVRATVSDRMSFGPKFDGSDIMFFDGSMRKYSPYKDNYLDLFNNGSARSVQAAIQGGNEKGNMRLSFSNYDYDGIVPNQGQIKNSLSFNGQMEVSKFAKFEFVQNIYRTKSQNRNPNIQQLVAWGTFNRDYDIKTAMKEWKGEDGYAKSMDEMSNINDGWGWPQAFIDGMGFFNMMYNMDANRYLDRRLNTITSAKTTLTFLPYLYLTVQGGLNYTDTDFENRIMPNRKIAETGKFQGGGFSFKRERNEIQNYESFLTFDKKFMDDKLSVTVFGGPAVRKAKYTLINVGTRGNSKFPGFWSLTNSDTWPAAYDSHVSGYDSERESLYSVLGQATISWGYEYVLNVNARNDWASTLPKENRSYFFPGASFIWNFTETFKDIPHINYGKLSVSFGDVGRPANRYFALKSYSMGTLPAPNTHINDITGPRDLFSGALKPERKREFEVLTNLRMFKQNRLELQLSYYKNTWYNQIMAVPVPASSGASNVRINAGEISNSGVELFLNGALIATNPFRWEMTLNLARQFDNITKLYPGITQMNEAKGNLIRRKAEGERMNTLWIQDYARDDKGNRMVNDNGLYYLSTDPKDEINVGSTNTDFFGGLTTNFYFQGDWGMLNFMGAFDYKFGGHILSYSNYYLVGNGLTKGSLDGRPGHGGLTWTQTLADGSTRERHDGMVLPGTKQDGTPNDIIVAASTYYSTFIHDMGTGWQPDYIMKNDYIKFREAALNYTFPKRISEKLKLQKLSLGITARNLFYLYKSIPNIDPESMLGTGNDSWVENSNFPSLRSYGFKLNVSF